MPTEIQLLTSPDAQDRAELAGSWLDARPKADPILVVAPTWEAGDDLVRLAARRSGARLGLVRLTLDRLAARLAAPTLAEAERAPASSLSFEAVCTRAIHAIGGDLTYFLPVARQPGFPRAASRTIEALRMSALHPDDLESLPRSGADLAALAARVEIELEAARLADRALVYRVAAKAAAAAPLPVGSALLLWDLPLRSTLEEELVKVLSARAPRVFATVPVGDDRSIAAYERCLGAAPRSAPPRSPTSALGALKQHLFAATRPSEAPGDDSVRLAAWPGEARECVEIARVLQEEAARGVRFDEMAILLRSPREYTPHLQEALRRADVPAYFARGTTRPHPAGRALLALLRCAAEGLSAQRFAEYLSLSQVPDQVPGTAADADPAWVPPDVDLLSLSPQPVAPSSDEGSNAILPLRPEEEASVEGTLRAPWRWEDLLVEAAVIGGEDRWLRRLEGLRAQFKRHISEIEDADESRVAYARKRLADLEHLGAYALPLVRALGALPAQALWGEWLDRLEALCGAALRNPAPVLATLAELRPMSEVGPIDLDEVQIVLGTRLREVAVAPEPRRYGAVYVAPAERVRGMVFDVVVVPGLAEKLFPRKISEDPILLDGERRVLPNGRLETQADRAALERLALRLAAGAARERLYLSYPRIDVDQARPRVPSFYALEAFRASEGVLPDFAELGARASGAAGGRLGWPAPERPEDAIDEAEYDLALLGPRIGADPERVKGAASYLLGANEHLARALRARARRWIRRWTSADGLVGATEAARAALAKHQLVERSYSPTALQLFASCPYRFLLQAVHRLQPREEPEALELIDPLTKGGMFHDTQFVVLTALRRDGLLPLSDANLARAGEQLDAALKEVADSYEEELEPAIPRVWKDGIASIRSDLGEWLRRMTEEARWIPHRFELSFGLVGRDRTYEDPESQPDPVSVLERLKLRGSIDLVERGHSGGYRATDHKTGRVYAKEDGVVGGGEILQPVLYALACEELLGEVASEGRLYYCTTAGGFTVRSVPIDEVARAAARQVIETIDAALQKAFFPAAPRAGACRYCDYRPICGPYEESRVERKPKPEIADLVKLRELP